MSSIWRTITRPLLLRATSDFLGDNVANKVDSKEYFLVQSVWGIMGEEPCRGSGISGIVPRLA